MGSSDEFLSTLCTSLNLGTLHQFGLPGMSRVFRWGEIGDMAKVPFWSGSRRGGLDLMHLRGHGTALFTKLPPTTGVQKPTQIPRCVCAYSSLPLAQTASWPSELLQKDLRALYMKGKGSRKGQGISKLQMLMCAWQLKLQVDNCNGLTHTWCLQNRETDKTWWNRNCWKYCWVCKQCLQI